MHKGNLFAPDPPEFSGKVIEMMDNFSNSYNYGDETDSPINSASVADICHLLRYYLISLPAAPLEPVSFRAITDLCVIPSAMERRKREENGTTLTEKEMLEDEEFRIVIAKLVLRLLPVAHFGALIYIVAFLAQLPTCSAADFTIDRLSNMFGYMVCAPRDALEYLELEQTFPVDLDFKMDLHKLEDASNSYIESLSVDTLHWLLTHWDYISEGLLQKDYQADIYAFQDLVADKVQAKNNDMATRHGSIPNAQATEAPSQVPAVNEQEQRTIPMVPRRLTGDDDEMLMGEPMLSFADGDDESNGEEDDSQTEEYHSYTGVVEHRQSGSSDLTAVSYSMDLAKQAQSALKEFELSRSRKNMGQDVKTRFTNANVRTPREEKPLFFSVEHQAMLDSSHEEVPFPTATRSQRASTIDRKFAIVLNLILLTKSIPHFHFDTRLDVRISTKAASSG